MIEAIMFFALGFLAASLIALVLFSALWHRIRHAVVASMAEVQADKDRAAQ